MVMMMMMMMVELVEVATVGGGWVGNRHIDTYVEGQEEMVTSIHSSQARLGNLEIIIPLYPCARFCPWIHHGLVHKAGPARNSQHLNLPYSSRSYRDGSLVKYKPCLMCFADIDCD